LADLETTALIGAVRSSRDVGSSARRRSSHDFVRRIKGALSPFRHLDRRLTLLQLTVANRAVVGVLGDDASPPEFITVQPGFRSPPLRHALRTARRDRQRTDRAGNGSPAAAALLSSSPMLRLLEVARPQPGALLKWLPIRRPPQESIQPIDPSYASINAAYQTLLELRTRRSVHRKPSGGRHTWPSRPFRIGSSTSPPQHAGKC